MNSQILNTRKAELVASQEKMLNAAAEAKLKLTDEQELTFAAAAAEIKDIDTVLARMAAVDKSKSELNAATSTLFVPKAEAGTKTKFSNCTPEYASAFWNGIRTRSLSVISNAALGEGGTAADGSFLVPAQTDPSIPNLAPIEASARRLSRVITTEMDLKIPYQSAKTTAAQKAESNNSSTNAFATSVPNFATTTLTAYMAGDQVAVSWELMQDVKALSQFVTADLQRAITNYEENIFINGTGSSQPLGYIPGATVFETASLTINNILDLVSQLKNAYYSNASFLFNRQEFHRLYKAQIAASQFQTYITYDPNGQARLLGFPVSFSSVMPTFGGSPVTNGAVLFGDFASGFVIGDRSDSNIRVKVLDQVAAQNGQTIILGYRRTDQRCVLQEAVQMLTTNG